MLENLVDYNYNHNAPLSNDKLWQAISTSIAETEEAERDIISDANNVTSDNFC